MIKSTFKYALLFVYANRKNFCRFSKCSVRNIISLWAKYWSNEDGIYGLRHAEIYPRQARVKFGHRKCFNFSEKGPPISSLEKNMRFSRRSKFPHFLEFPGNNLNAKIYPRMFFIHFHIVQGGHQIREFREFREKSGNLHAALKKWKIVREKGLKCCRVSQSVSQWTRVWNLLYCLCRMALQISIKTFYWTFPSFSTLIKCIVLLELN